MAKPKRAIDSKFTNKNITFNYQVNTNDEAVPGFVNIAKSIKVRAGYAQSDIFPITVGPVKREMLIFNKQLTSPGQTNVTTDITLVGSDVYPIGTVTGNSYGTRQWFHLQLFSDPTDGYCKPAMVYTPMYSFALGRLEFNMALTANGTPILMHWDIYDYNPSSQQLGNKIGTTSTFTWNDIPSQPYQTCAFTSKNNTTYMEPVRFNEGNNYMLKLIFETPINISNLPITTHMDIEAGIVDPNNCAVRITEVPTQPTVYTPVFQEVLGPNGYPAHDPITNDVLVAPVAFAGFIKVNEIIQITQNLNLTDIYALGGANAQVIVTRTVNPLSNSFGWGTVSTPTSTVNTTGSDSSYPVISMTDLICPALTPTGTPTPYVKVTQVNADGTRNDGFTVNSLGDKYPAAYYGSHIENSMHDFGCMLGGHLTGRATKTNDFYPMFKRAAGDTNFHRIEAMVYKTYVQGSWPSASSFGNNGFPFAGNPGDWDFIHIDSSTTPTVPAGANEGSSTDTLRSGVYEYAIEFIDKTGYAYQTSLDNCTIVRKQVGGYLSAYDQQYANELANQINPSSTTLSNLKANYSNLNGRFLANACLAIPVPSGPIANASAADFPIVNVYRRGIRYFQLAGVGSVSDNAMGAGDPPAAGRAVFDIIETPDSVFQFVTSLTPAQFSTGWPSYAPAGQPGGPIQGFWYYEDTLAQSVLAATTLDQKDYYVPRPMDFTIYKGHIIAAGDPTYPNYIFPSGQVKCDFNIIDQQQVTFPPGDTYFTAATTLNDWAFVFSKRGTWLIWNNLTESPYFEIRQISSRLGCVGSSKSIVRWGQNLLIPTIEGLQWFNGSTYTPADESLNNIWNHIQYGDQMTQTGGTPNLTVGHVPSFTVSSFYDPLTRGLFLTMPGTSLNVPKTMYQLNTTTMTWSLVTPSDVRFIYQLELNNNVGYVNNSDHVFKFDDTLLQDFPNDTGLNGVTIPTNIKSINMDFGETSLFKLFRIWGNGLVNVNFYFDREVVPTSQYTNIDLSSQDIIGVALDLGWSGNYFQFEIQALDANFELKAFELVYSNTGIKRFKNIAAEPTPTA